MKRWTFAHTGDMCEDYLARIPLTTDPYREALLSREGKEKMLNDALNAALENLMSWERAAAERAAPTVWELSARERALQALIDKREGAQP